MNSPRFRPIRVLGHGGAGTVTLCADTLHGGRLVALKRVSEVVQDTLSVEFEALRGLVHPNVAEVVDLGWDDDGAWLAEAYVDGQTLRARLDDRAEPISFATAVGLLAEVLRALEYLHARGLVHGDVKPENILVTSGDARAVLIDFGVCRRAGTRGVGVSGSIPYAAPEVIREEPAAASQDLYAVGMLAYELATGRHPFAELAGAALLKAQLETLPPPPSSTQPPLPPLFDSLVMALLEKRASERPKTAREVLDRLSDAAGRSLELDTVATLRSWVSTAPMVGREASLERAASVVVDETPSGTLGSPFALWVSGGAGVGRSRFLAEIGAMATAAGCNVVRAFGRRDTVLGPVTQWLRGLGQRGEVAEGARDRWEAIDRAVADLLAAASMSARRILLVLDDVDLADDATRDAVRLLVTRLEYLRSSASEVPAPSLGILVASTGGSEAVLSAKTAFEDLPLGPLDASALRQWLGQLFGGAAREVDDVDGLTMAVGLITRLTGGVAGLVVGLFGALAEQGKIHRRGGGLSLSFDGIERALPADLAAALAVRESALTEFERTVLGTLRALGQAAPARLIARLIPDAAPVGDALVRLMDRGFVGTAFWAGDADPVRYRADLGGASEPEAARRVHSAIARELVSLGGRESVRGFGFVVAARHAQLAVEAGETRLGAVGYRAALAGAVESRACLDLVGEVDGLSIAMALAPDDAARANVALELSARARRIGRFELAVSSATAALAAAPGRAAVALAEVALDRGDLPGALSRLASVTSDDSAYADALAARSRALVLSGRYDDAELVILQGLAASPGLAATARLRQSRALTRYYGGRLDEAIAEFEVTADAFRAAGDPAGEAAAVNGVGLVHHRRGEFEGALAAYERSRTVAFEGGDRRRVAVAAMNIGTVLQETGRAVEAAERYRESLREAELLGDEAGLARAANNLGNLLVFLNRLPEAMYWIDRSDTIALRQDTRVLTAYNEALRGKIFHRRGEHERARKHLLAAVTQIRETGSAGEAGEFNVELGLVARTVGDATGVDHFAAAAAQLAEASGADKQLAAVAFLRGEARRLRGELDLALPFLKEALAAADRHRLTELAWQAEGAIARVFRERGNALEARTRFGACSERIFAQTAGLSGRERELFLAEPERARLIEESRLALAENGSEGGATQRGQVDRLFRVLEINRRLVTERDLQRLLEAVLDSAVSLTGAERGFVILVQPGADGSDYDVRAARNIDQESLKKQRAKVSTAVLRDVIERGEPVITVDAGEDVRFRDSASVHSLRLRSILCLPLKAHGAVVGAIYLDNRFQSSTFSDADLDIISAFGDQAAVAIVNARLHEEREAARRELEASHARIAALNQELEARLVDQTKRLELVELNFERQRSELVTRYSYDNIVGQSAPMKRLFGVLDRVTDTSVPVLVQGESGTGKELVARAVHYNSGRAQRPFVSVNCAALTETLLESELFGHTKGSFTGADRDRKGLFEVADEGTLFLDEVADMSLAMQAKLLRALQEGEIWPVGARKAVKVDVRIVAACNRDLAEMVRQNTFRQDLYFRLNVVRVILPPLRERGEDLILLVRHFFERFEREQRRHFTISHSAIDLLMGYPWPGNVRELEACLLNACLFCDGDILTDMHFAHKPELHAERRQSPSTKVAAGAAPSLAGGERLDLGAMTLAELEEKAILAALERANGNKVDAARRLGVTRQTLYNKLKTLSIEVRRDVRRVGGPS